MTMLYFILFSNHATAVVRLQALKLNSLYEPPFHLLALSLAVFNVLINLLDRKPLINKGTINQ